MSGAKRSIQDLLPLGKTQTFIPQLGFGVYRSPPSTTTQSCLTALSVGYRHIDTAQYYGNESQVGEAVEKSGLRRSDIFLTTKILSHSNSVEEDYKSCLESVQRLNPGYDGSTSYVDLFLIHSPNAGQAARKQMWQALERLHFEGRARSIGVSNYSIKHIDEMRSYASVWPPHVNQIELHPWLQSPKTVEYCHQNGIVVEAYCPLARNKHADNETLRLVGQKHSVTSAQVLVRYALEKGWVPLPKSDNPEHIRTNRDVFRLKLDQDDMAALDSLHLGRDGALVQTVDDEDDD